MVSFLNLFYVKATLTYWQHITSVLPDPLPTMVHLCRNGLVIHAHTFHNLPQDSGSNTSVFIAYSAVLLLPQWKLPTNKMLADVEYWPVGLEEQQHVYSCYIYISLTIIFHTVIIALEWVPRWPDPSDRPGISWVKGLASKTSITWDRGISGLCKPALWWLVLTLLYHIITSPSQWTSWWNRVILE